MSDVEVQRKRGGAGVGERKQDQLREIANI